MNREELRWVSIRKRRNELLKKFVDPFIPYIAFGGLSPEVETSVRELRKKLLDLPAEIQAKIDSGELESVLKYRFSEREILGIPDPTVQSEIADNSGEQ